MNNEAYQLEVDWYWKGIGTAPKTTILLGKLVKVARGPRIGPADAAFIVGVRPNSRALVVFNPAATSNGHTGDLWSDTIFLPGHPCGLSGYWGFFHCNSQGDSSEEGIQLLELLDPPQNTKPIPIKEIEVKGTPMWALDPNDPEDPVNVFRQYWRKQ